jgi:hypothetical protein
MRLSRLISAPSAMIFAIVFGEADPPLALARWDALSSTRWQAFANQNAPIKVLAFQGILCIRHVGF